MSRCPAGMNAQQQTCCRRANESMLDECQRLRPLSSRGTPRDLAVLGYWARSIGVPRDDSWMKLVAVLVLLLASFAYSQLPTCTISDAIGVNIHFTDPAPGEMQMID